MCEECEEERVQFFCQHCEQKICAECDQRIHNKSKRAQHKREAYVHSQNLSTLNNKKEIDKSDDSQADQNKKVLQD